MALNIIPSDLPTLTTGERKILEKLRSLYKPIEREAFLYVQPRVRNLEPDFILIDSERGVSILEIKDWGISYIDRVNRRKVYLNDKKEVDNPLYKANRYFNAVNDMFRFQDVLTDNNRKLKFKVYSHVIFTNITSEEIEENNLHSVFDQFPSKYISASLLRRLSIERLFGIEWCSLDDKELVAIRTLFFPEIKIAKPKEVVDVSPHTDDLIRALDVEQERFAKRIPYGHYMVTGVPGSGKTVILLARAIHFVRHQPDWKIKILTYNKSLKNSLENKLNLLADDLNFSGVRLENIDISTFHKFALEMSNVDVPEQPKDEWWNETLPSIALTHATPKYDAILIDEYQDFYDDWIRLCIKACREHTFIDNKKEEKKGINLFLAGDRLQSIYNTREQSWKDIGINMQGRSSLLKRSYRAGSEHIDLALNFLRQHKSLETEVEHFYSPRNELSFANQVQDSVTFLEGSIKEVGDAISNLVCKAGKPPKDILVLCKSRFTCNKIRAALMDDPQRRAEVEKNITEGRLVITTYHSSKGLEAPITFLIQVDSFAEQSKNQNDIQQRKLLYVGMTRASEHLYIHACNYRDDNFAGMLRGDNILTTV